MEDFEIIGLFWKRSEEAITLAKEKYGRYCLSIALHILKDYEDARECENDTYFKAWNVIPPKKPEMLQAFLGKITRNLSLDRYQMQTAQKRGGGQVLPLLEELMECLPGEDFMSQIPEQMVLTKVLDAFLKKQPKEKRQLFVRRYWYADSIAELAERFGLGESKVKMRLLRMRGELKKELEREDIIL